MGSLINLDKYGNPMFPKKGVSYSAVGSCNIDMTWEPHWGHRSAGLVHGNLHIVGSWECFVLLKVEHG